MSNEFSEFSIIRTVAKLAADHAAKQTITYCQSLNAQLSGDDSGLDNVWDEICVQIQFAQSHIWDAYLDTVNAFVAGLVEALPHHQLAAIWYQTRDGSDWLCLEPADRHEPYIADIRREVVDYIIAEHLFTMASNWSNDRVRAYIDRL